MPRHSLVIGGILLGLTLTTSAQTPPPDAMTVARSLVVTLKLGDQYKALLPAILFRIKPLVTQERAELESDYDLIVTKAGDLYAPYYNEMREQAAAVYAANFTLDELFQMDAFFRQPAGQKLIEKWSAMSLQTAQIGQDVGRKASEDLRQRLTEALRQKGHRL
ncbi:hypothetical protein AB7M49_006627 [Bradyrhizobium elkanii]|nr:hypothetical protein [Bradyrhizobium elkanii]